MEGNSWSPSVDQPKIQIAEYSLSVGPTKSETEAVKVWVTYLLLAEPTPCPILLKKRRTTASHLLQRDKSNQNAIFKLFKPLQLIPALHSTGNNEFWYCSCSRLMHNSSKTTGSNQNILEMKKYDGRPITMSIPVQKGLREQLPRPRPVRKLLSLC
jgi:hypothetical protein